MRLLKLRGALTNRRRSRRMEANGLQIVYWNGSKPVMRGVRDISFHGASVETPDRWYSGTIMQIQLVTDLHPPTDESIPVIDRPENHAPEPEPEAVARETHAETNGCSDAVDAETANADAVNSHQPEAAQERLVADSDANSGVCEAKVSFPLLVKVVRSISSGMCIEFLFDDHKQQRALRYFLMAVEDRNRARKPKADTSDVPARAAKAGVVHP